MCNQKEPPYDSAVPLLGIYLKTVKTLIQEHMCTSLVIAAVFTIANTWKLSKCPSTDKWIEKTEVRYIIAYIFRHIHTMEYYSATEKN